jgi:glutathione S-transferase
LKLFYSKYSPFARKVLITAHLTGHVDHIEIIDFMKTGSFKPSEDYHRSNPLLKIPALQILPDNAIIDSPVICEYLNAFSLQDNIYPLDQNEYFFQRKLESIADGACDATVLRRYESLRPTNLFSQDYDNTQKLKVENSLDYLETIADDFKTPYMIGEISIMCMLSYLDLRFSKEDWRISRPKLTKWYEECQTWEPFQSTSLG